MNLLRTMIVGLGVLLVWMPQTFAGKPKVDPIVAMTQELEAAISAGNQKGIEKVLAQAEKKPADALKIAQTLIDSQSEDRIRIALGIIDRNRSVEAVRMAVAKLEDPEFEYKIVVLEKVSTFEGDAQVIKGLLGLAASRLPFEREKAVEALGKIAPPEAVPALVKASTDGMFSVRIAAARALGSYDVKEAIEALGRVLTTDSNMGVRTEAARALSAKKSKLAIPFLIAGLKDTSFTVQSAAADSLRELTGMDLGTDNAQWEAWQKRESK